MKISISAKRKLWYTITGVWVAALFGCIWISMKTAYDTSLIWSNITTSDLFGVIGVLVFFLFYPLMKKSQELFP